MNEKVYKNDGSNLVQSGAGNTHARHSLQTPQSSSAKKPYGGLGEVKNEVVSQPKDEKENILLSGKGATSNRQNFQSRMTAQLRSANDQSFQSQMTDKLTGNSILEKGGSAVQGKFEGGGAPSQSTGMAKSNNPGLPSHLKSAVENLSGYSMDDVQVHFNSDKPAQFQAHAYAQGSEIHLSPGQEKHLPHEAWHLVQQKQGRVKPTSQLKGKVNVNDDVSLEREADTMGAKAAAMNNFGGQQLPSPPLQKGTGQGVGSLQTTQFVPGQAELEENKKLYYEKRRKHFEAVEATEILYAAPVLNMTRIRHYLFDQVTGDFGEVLNATLKDQDNIKNHLVNKWERVEGGEQEMPQYDLNEDRNAAASEANQLEQDLTDYINLPSHMKMQFALVGIGDCKQYNYGRSSFRIKKEKAEQGFIHWGDSGYTAFSGERLRYGDRPSTVESLKRREDYRKGILNGNISSWIEINIPNGVAIPGDIEMITVDLQEFNEMVDFIAPEGRSRKKTIKKLKKILKKWSGGKYEIK